MTGKIVEQWCKEKNFDTLPDYILFRVFKQEKEFEIWAGNGNTNKLTKIKTLGVCAIMSEPGPKLREWDYNTVEGFYTYNIYYTGQSYYTYVRLTNKGIDSCGNVTYGSCFKMLINYPNAFDSRNADIKFGNHIKQGTNALHGNCVSACCVSFENKLWVTVFAFALLHNDSRYGKHPIHIFPCRFDKTEVKELFHTRSQYELKDSVFLYPFWDNLKEGYFRFEKNHSPLRYSVDKKGYHFEP